ncbi:MAG TPA: enoyl-CoA hydratase [Myxococcales bacterium]|nr:enoyl-CoA hydratase [Myxococcales bacterium]
MNPSDKMLARKDARVGTMIFNNPERHNAVSLEMWQAAAKILDDFAADEEIRVVVLAGAGGKAFVSGADISRFEDERATREAVERYNAATEKVYSGVATFPKPTIAMIQGYCIGGGLNLSICCDLRFCSESSRFGLPAAKLGLGYGYPGLKRFIDTIGPAHTKDIFFSARQLGAAEALAMGIVNRVLPDAELSSFVETYARGVAANAPLTVQAVKQISLEVLRPESERDLKRAADLVARCFASDDYVEGRRAFLEKRDPVFTGK